MLTFQIKRQAPFTGSSECSKDSLEKEGLEEIQIKRLQWEDWNRKKGESEVRKLK